MLYGLEIVSVKGSVCYVLGVKGLRVWMIMFIEGSCFRLYRLGHMNYGFYKLQVF